MKVGKIWSAAAVVAVCSLVAAGGAGSVASASPRAASKKPIAISMFGSIPGTVINIKTNWFTKYVERRFHVKFNWDLVADNDVATKQPVLLASGDYPAVIWQGSLSQTDVLKYGSQGVIVPLNGLLKKYAPNVWHQLHTIPGAMKDLTAPNGKIYALGGYNACFHCYWTYNYYINIKYLNEFGLSMPKTTAQFAHVLNVFKQHGLVPLTGSNPATGGGYAEDVVTYLMNAFIPYNGGTSYFDVKNGKAVFVPSQPQWKAGLEYIHRLYANGDFSKVALTQLSTQVESQILNQRVGVVPNGAIETAIPGYGSAKSHYLDWLKMQPLKGPKGLQSAAFSGIGFGFNFAITNKATKAQEIAIMKLLNFIWTPKGTQMMDFGPSGKFWTPAKKGQDGLNPTQALFDTNWNTFYSGNGEQNEGWNQWSPLDQSDQWRDGQAGPGPFAPAGSNEMDHFSTQVAMAGYQPKWQYPPWAWVPEADGQTYATDSTNIDNYVGQWTDDFITGEKSISADWSAYLAGLKKLDLAQFVQIGTKAMHGDPENAHISEYERSEADIHYMLCSGTVPALDKKYLLQQGVPNSAFACSK